MMIATIAFLSRVDVGDENECWPFRGNISTGGYGRYKNKRAHRVSYELLVGPIPDGLDLDHLCRTRSCQNPFHLEPVTRGENVRRGLKGRMVTHCPKGHEYTAENTRLSEGRRHCVACRRAYDRGRRDAASWRAYRAKRREAGRPLP